MASKQTGLPANRANCHEIWRYGLTQGILPISLWRFKSWSQNSWCPGRDVCLNHGYRGCGSHGMDRSLTWAAAKWKHSALGRPDWRWMMDGCDADFLFYLMYKPTWKQGEVEILHIGRIVSRKFQWQYPSFRFLGPKGTDSDASRYSSCARISASLKLSQLHALAAFFSKGKLHTCYWKRRFQVHLPPCDRHGWMLCERVSFWKLHRILVRRKVVEKPLTNHRQTGESRWRAMLGLMSRLFAFLAHVQAVQPVAGPFFARWRLASHGDTSPCLLVFRATLLFFPAKLYICGPNVSWCESHQCLRNFLTIGYFQLYANTYYLTISEYIYIHIL